MSNLGLIESAPGHIVLSLKAEWPELGGSISPTFAPTFSLFEATLNLAIPYLTLCFYPSRAETETVSAFVEVMQAQALDLAHKGIGLRFIGAEQYEQAPQEVWQSPTPSKPALTVSVMTGYDGRAEFVQAVRRLQAAGQQLLEPVAGAQLETHFYTAGLPAPDLVIYTGGEKRLRPLMIWQAAYAEFLFIETEGLTLDGQGLHCALAEYTQRQRRFGSG